MSASSSGDTGCSQQPATDNNPDAASVSGQRPEWQPFTGQIDRSLLLARDPILCYDEVPLYESELDDNGVSRLSVKVVACDALHVLSKPTSLLYSQYYGQGAPG